MLLYPPEDSTGKNTPQASPPNSQLPALSPNPNPSPSPSPPPMDVDSMPQAATPVLPKYPAALQDNVEPAAYNVEGTKGPVLEPLSWAPGIRIYKPQIPREPLAPFNLQRAPPRSPSPALNHNHMACTIIPPEPETVIDEFLLDGWPNPPCFQSILPVPSEYDPMGTPLPATPLCNSPKPEEVAQAADPEENCRFFANLLHIGDEDSELDIGNGQQDLGNEQEDMDIGAGGDEGLGKKEEIEGGGWGPEDQELEPPIQDIDKDEEDPNKEELVAAFQEHPILRNIYL
ncbi:hypothetical protein RSOLAG1IB_11922 [Rhizoctonia solani AG-1 IB]|uniref:Uncharacterized protein n=1 Tax=Thanatephorus cucumeris (strain AG1-IB / isolate 7/3/14) TaxID=1108050 RepID=M5CCX0_THACB|nr:hypothetical protein BN14_11134 [Rhizoctonia solani AG-1 IB]CEL56450.1 hypothetical protein RSOLAG1IB_11922 [Rhizoctonia solani AG-1 IB]